MWKRLAIAGLCVGQCAFSSDFIPPPSLSPLKLFSGSCSKDLAAEVAGILGVQLGRLNLSRFADGELSINVLEDVAGKDVYIIASMGNPVNDSIIELLLLASALKRGNCARIIVVVPYMAYNRQDSPQPGNLFAPAEDLPKMLEAFDIDLIVGVDFHGEHVDGQFGVPVIKLNPYELAIRYLKTKTLSHPIVVSPDVRATKRTHLFYRMLVEAGIPCDLALLPNPGSSLSYIGGENSLISDVMTGRDVIIVDDMMITGSTVFKCVEEVRKRDAEKVYCFATHPVLPGDAIRKINKSNIDEVICTNTLPLNEKSAKIVQLSVAGMISKQIIQIFESSVSN
jgi:ribose-phosphate pyrophosphokinase